MQRIINFVLVAFVFSFILISPHLKADKCAELNCDCVNIPNGNLIQQCVIREQRLRDICSKGRLSENQFCGFHGPKGSPVAYNVPLPALPPSENTKESNRKIEQLYWSMKQDLTFAMNSYESEQFSAASSVINISERNLTSLFEAQLSVVEVWEREENTRRVVRAWKKYSTDGMELAELWHSALKNLVRSAQSEVTSPPKRDFVIALAKIVISMYQYAGHSFGESERFDSAAIAWKASSDVSTDLLSILVYAGAEASELIKLRNQAASQLQRASLYWMLASDEKDPEKKAKGAIEFASDEQLNEILSGAGVKSP